MKKKELTEIVERHTVLINELSRLTSGLLQSSLKQPEPIKEIISQEAIDQIKETDNAIYELDKSMDRLKEKLYMDNITLHDTYLEDMKRIFPSKEPVKCPKECCNLDLIRETVRGKLNNEVTEYYECNTCGKRFNINS